MGMRAAVGAALAAVTTVCAGLALAPSAVAAPYVYASTGADSTLLQYDTPGGLLTPLTPASFGSAPTPLGIAASPNGKSVYISSGQIISQYDVSGTGTLTPKTPATVSTAPYGVQGLTVSPDSLSVYAAMPAAVNSTTTPGAIGMFTADANGKLTPKAPATVPGELYPASVVYSPNGPSVYVANFASDNVSQYSVGAGGVLTAKAPATLAAGDSPITVDVRPDGSGVYVTNRSSASISQFTAAAGGALSPMTPASITASDVDPFGLAISPDGNSAYVGHLNFHGISQYSIGNGGALTPKSPPIVSPTKSTDEVVVSPNGLHLYGINRNAKTISQYTIGPGGKLTEKNPATVSATGASVDISAIAIGPSLDPFPTVTRPVDGALVNRGAAVTTAFTCTEGIGGPGITSCTDQGGHASGTALDTSTPGDRTLTVTATSSSGKTASRTVAYTVVATTSAPTAAAQTVTTPEDSPTTFALDAADADGDPLTATVTRAPERGVVSCTGTTCTYTPNANANGADSFDHTVTDGTETAAATVTVKVTPVNDPPVAKDVAITIDKGSSLALVLSGTDPENDPLTFVAGTPAHGTVSCVGASCTYRPVVTYVGPDTIPFTVSDGNGGTATGKVVVTVAGAIVLTPKATASCRRAKPKGRRRATATCKVTLKNVANGRTTARLLSGKKVLARAKGTIRSRKVTLRFTRAKAFPARAKLALTIPAGRGTARLTASVRLR